MKRKQSIFLVLTGVFVTIIALWFTNRAITPITATWEDVVAEAKNGGYQLIDTESLADLYLQGPEEMLVIDTRQDWEYRAGHIKGAANFPMEPTWWSRWKKADELIAMLGEDKSKIVVFY